MAIIGKVLAFFRDVRNGAQAATVKTLLYGNNIVSAIRYGAPGDDSAPLNTDIPLLVRTGSGEYAVIGFADPSNAGGADPGERTLYSRSATGTVMARIRLKAGGDILLSSSNAALLVSNDGSITGTNTVAGTSFELQAGGMFVSSGISLSTHTHAYTDNGVAMVTGVPNP